MGTALAEWFMDHANHGVGRSGLQTGVGDAATAQRVPRWYLVPLAHSSYVLAVYLHPTIGEAAG